MKITIEIPDWAADRHLYVLAGIECVAYRMAGESTFKTKTGRCAQCGECCKDQEANWVHGMKPNGDCAMLKDLGNGRYECKMGMYRSLACCVDNVTAPYTEHCNIRFE